MTKYLKFIVFSVVLVVSGPAFALKKAIIKSERAVIYADTEMTAPIGYVKRGKEITVSLNTDRSGKLYRLIVNQRIAYIRQIDLYLLDDFGNNEDLRKRRNINFK